MCAPWLLGFVAAWRGLVVVGGDGGAGGGLGRAAGLLVIFWCDGGVGVAAGKGGTRSHPPARLYVCKYYSLPSETIF